MEKGVIDVDGMICIEPDEPCFFLQCDVQPSNGSVDCECAMNIMMILDVLKIWIWEEIERERCGVRRTR